MKQVESLNVAIVGGGEAGKAIMDMISSEKFRSLRMKLIGVADLNPDSPGYLFAQEKGVYTAKDYRELYKLKDLNIIIEVTGNENVTDEICRTKPRHIRLIDHIAAHFLLDVFRIEEREIANCKIAPEALRGSEEKLAGVIASITDHMSMIDEKYNIIWTNDVAKEMFGPDLIGGKCYRAYHSNDKPCEPCVAQKCFEDGKIHEQERVINGIHGNKMIFWCTASVASRHRDGRPKMVVEIFRDTTERKQAQKTLQEARDELETQVKKRTAELGRANESLQHEIDERRKAEDLIRRRLMFEKAISAISSRLINISNLDKAIDNSLADIGKISGADRAYLFLFRQDGTVMENTHEWCAEGVSPEIDNLKNLSCKVFPWWTNKLHKGEIINIKDISTMPIEAKAEREILERQDVKSILVLPVNIKGRVAGFLGLDNVREPGGWTDYDLAILRTSSELIGTAFDRKRAKEALQESEERYRTLFDLFPQAIVLTDISTGRLIEVNDEFCRRTKYAREEIIGRTTTELFYSKEERHRFLKAFQESGEIRGLEMDFRAGDDSILHTLMFSRLIRITGESVILTIFVDQTHRKRLEAQLLHAQKMEAIGTLAGGIAHAFNNLLMGIRGNASLMLLDIDPKHPHYKRVKTIEGLVQGGAELTGQLLGYAMEGRYEVKPFDLNELVKKSAEAFGRTKKEITIFLELAEDLFFVEADKNQISQVLWNLYANAADAMPERGKLSLKTTNVRHDTMDCKLNNATSGSYVLLTITDTGMGMDKNTLERIFDPFFTTKEVGRGTGLGLPSVYGIITGHGGHIDVNSERGAGTTFSIYIPASGGKSREHAEPTERFDKGSGTVLLVDDEEIILEAGQELLEAMDYKVLVAGNGKQAIDTYKINRDDIDIIVLDIVMPDMSGGEVYERIKEISPDVKVILSSGYSIDGKAAEIMERGCNDFIQKPFNVNALHHKIREILEKK
jgi:PAS domain S-box-containing protein